MYKYYNWRRVGNCVIQKSVRIDEETYDIIMTFAHGGSFSDGVRRMAHWYRWGQGNNIPEKK